jgi:hypothetical protein|nr:MAG TPA: adenine-specific methyltransferase [Caudoviricetes sp.]
MIVAEVAKNKNDEYYTPSYAIEPIKKYVKEGSVVWCPFDTEQSLFAKEFRKMGCNVIYSHIDRGEDFFTMDTHKCDYIVSNPPYSLKTEVLQRLFEIGKPFAMLVGVVGLFESKRRFEMFRNNEFECMYLNKMVSYFKSYDDQKPSINPPFSSIYVCHNMLPKQIIFEEINK